MLKLNDPFHIYVWLCLLHLYLDAWPGAEREVKDERDLVQRGENRSRE